MAALSACAAGPRPMPSLLPQAHAEMAAKFGPRQLRPGQYLWTPAAVSSGPAQVVISLREQRAYVFRANQLIGVSSISTGKQGKETPRGFFVIQEKKPFYRSKKYDNAPMPWMQRIDEYGIALHGGDNPGYPASHGCIRLPLEFAKKLYGITTVGNNVIIEG